MRYEQPVRGQFDVSIHAAPSKCCDIKWLLRFHQMF